MEFDPGPTPDIIDWYEHRGKEPTIVSISDIHGYLDAAQNALTAVGKTDAYPPVVTSDEEGVLHWADNDYLLLINGDLIDRGPDNLECLDLLTRLADEAPPGRVRYHLGNHEMGILFPDRFRWPNAFSINLDRELRRSFVEKVASGRISVAFEGYHYTYSHAGDNEQIDNAVVNEAARSVCEKLLTMCEEGRFDENHIDLLPHYEGVFGTGGQYGRGPSAGPLWMDFKHMTPEAPPQVVGHTRHRQPTRKAQVVCQNVIRSNLDSPGGESVLLERPGELVAVTNSSDGTTVQEI